jgi:O-antigen biosynthesis protein
VSGRLRTRAKLDGSRKRVLSAAVELTERFDLPERPTNESGAPYDEARLLVRIGGEPIGFATVDLASQPLSSPALVAAIERDLTPAVSHELERQGLPRLAALVGPGVRSRAPTRSLAAARAGGETVTVVVCTRDRSEILRGCLHALQALEHEPLDFVIVDNAPSDSGTRSLVTELAREDSRFRYVHEPRPGLSQARNRGLVEATGEIVGYTDDDVRVDAAWIVGLLRGFHRRRDVACVTGLVASASLELAAQQYFDARVWWSSSCEPRLYDARHGPHDTALHPYAAGVFGTGANFAFRTELLRRVGGFDESLGAGSPCAGGEDLDIFVRLVRAGHAISYEPAALVWHEHRADGDDLSRQMYAYGKALSAYLFKYASSRATALDVLSRIPQGLCHLGALGARSSRAGSETGYAYRLLLAELRGVLAGPFAYARARRAQDPERRRIVAP